MQGAIVMVLLSVGGEGCDTAGKALCGSERSLINLLVPCCFKRDPPNPKAQRFKHNKDRNEIAVHHQGDVSVCSGMSLPVTVQDGVYPVGDC